MLLAFRGSSLRIGNIHDGDLSRILELFAHYDPLLREHVEKVKSSQEKGEQIQGHQLSPQSQNEFTKAFTARGKNRVLEERANAKHFSIVVDVTLDSSHIEQTLLFVLRYLKNTMTLFLLKSDLLSLSIAAIEPAWKLLQWY